MENGKARAWKKIGLFYGLTMLFSGIFDGFVLHAGKMDAGNLLYVTGSMWSPALAAFATKRIFGERIRDLPWKWGPIRYPWLGYLIPIAYALPVYLVVWIGGLGGFANAEFIKQTAAQFGWSNFPPALTHTLFIQSIFTPLTRETGPTKYIIDEFGIGLVITVTIAAIVVWRHSRSWTSATSP